MSRRLRTRWLVGALVTFASGCTTLTPISPRVGLSLPEVEVRFASPIRLVARTHAGAEVVRRDVTRVVGRPLEVRNDTLVLEVTRWQGIGLLSQNRESPPLVAALPVSDSSTDIGTRRYSRGRTAALILGPPVIAWALLFILCSMDPCFT